MARQRPVAGQRNRARLGTVVLESPPAATEPEPAAPAAEPARIPATRPPREPRAGRRVDVVLLVSVLVTIALVLTAGLLAIEARGADRAEAARSSAVSAAEGRAVDLLSYDYRHLDRDFARARAGLTGRFAHDYAATTQSVVRPTAEQVKAVVKADVVASSVVSASQNRVVVLVFVNQTTTSDRLDGPRVDLDRVRMTLDRVGGSWLVSKVVAL